MCAQQITTVASEQLLTSRQRRRLLIDIAKRRIQPGTGSSHAAMLRRTAMTDWPDLRHILQPIEWVIVGGVATRAYMPERMTKDMDILIRAADETSALAQLQAAGYKVVQALAIAGYVLKSDDEIEIDLLLGSQPWLEEALAHPEIDSAGYPVLALPYLVLMKMAASRGRDLGDITTMLGWANETALKKVRAVVAAYSPQDSEDLESLIFIGQQERRHP
jgi:hypothetical protein